MGALSVWHLIILLLVLIPVVAVVVVLIVVVSSNRRPQLVPPGGQWAPAPGRHVGHGSTSWTHGPTVPGGGPGQDEPPRSSTQPSL